MKQQMKYQPSCVKVKTLHEIKWLQTELNHGAKSTKGLI